MSPKKHTLVDAIINTPPFKRNKINHAFNSSANIELSSDKPHKPSKPLINNTSYYNHPDNNFNCFDYFKNGWNYISKCWNSCWSYIKKIFN